MWKHSLKIERKRVNFDNAREAESDDASLNIKWINLDALPPPKGFKVTFEHATDHHADDEDYAQIKESEHAPA